MVQPELLCDESDFALTEKQIPEQLKTAQISS